MNVIGKFHLTVRHEIDRADVQPPAGDTVPQVTQRRHSDARQRAWSVVVSDRLADGEPVRRQERKAS